MAITHKKVGGYSNVTLYQATDGNITIPYEITRKRDRIGTLLVSECSYSEKKYFETYSMADVKANIATAFTQKENNNNILLK